MVSSKWHSTLNIIFSNRFIKINSFIFYSCYRMRSFKKKSFLFCNTETKTSKAWHFCGLQPYETKPILTILTAIIIQHNEKRKITTKQNVLVLVWLLPRRKKKTNPHIGLCIQQTNKKQTFSSCMCVISTAFDWGVMKWSCGDCCLSTDQQICVCGTTKALENFFLVRWPMYRCHDTKPHNFINSSQMRFGCASWRTCSYHTTNTQWPAFCRHLNFGIQALH